jgi:isocitrate/isopropylmalate dehydrogenase
MKSFNIAVIAGDSIGKEVVPEGIPGMQKSRIHRAPPDGASVTAITLEIP